MHTPGARARELFGTDYFCAESVLKALAEAHGAEAPCIPGIATGFCGGVSRTSGMCGALSGAVMALGLVHGRKQAGAPVDECYRRVNMLVSRFAGRFGSTGCTALCGVDLSTDEGRAAFRDGQLRVRICLDLAEAAADMAHELMAG